MTTQLVGDTPAATTTEQVPPVTPEEQAQMDAATDPQDSPAAPEPGTRSQLGQRLASQPRPDVLAAEDTYSEARTAVAEDRGTEDDWEAVTEWLLSDTTEVLTRKLKIRVGGSDTEPRVVPWIVRAIPIDVIRAAEREGAGNRQQRRGGNDEYDELKANIRVLVEGTVKPDLKAAARQKGIADAAVLVHQRFAFKPGLIAQIAGEVMSVSGFDTDDVRAAGNS